MQKIPLRNIRLGFQTPRGIFENVEEAEAALARCDWDINLISVVRIGDKDDRTLGKQRFNEVTNRWETIGSFPIVITVLADENGFEAPI